MPLPAVPLPIDYDRQEGAFAEFLLHFKPPMQQQKQDITAGIGNFTLNDNVLCDDEVTNNGNILLSRRRAPPEKYLLLLQQLADREMDEFLVDLDDLADYEDASGDYLKLVQSIENNTKHYIEIVSRAIDKSMPPPSAGLSFKDDVLDILMARRQARNRELLHAAEGDPTRIADTFPADLMRRYTLVFKPRTCSSNGHPIKALAVREVRGENLGKLITVRAMATRVTDVKPIVQVSAYTCDRCGCEIFQPIIDRQYWPLTQCPSEDCIKNQAKGQLHPSSRASKFLPFQEVKVQEVTEQVPVGQIPRSLTVRCLGSTVRRVNPGDVVDISGIFLPTPYTGFHAMQAGLLTDTYLDAHYVVRHKKAYSEMIVDPSVVQSIDRFRRSGRVYELLARSIAPEIYGHLDVKKALLLLLIGGVTKELGDGMKIRGTINICLMGDPGVAKSQLLKYISKVAPRGVYTSGRGSSGVGLTAAVMRDPVTDEMVLEGGALVLADNGICCIDEFDKMDDHDRTAIHEVMEQQTISIAKAGISTSLNARTSILAAANPLYGRYNPRLSPVENINLPAALLSRFDVVFLMLDTPSRDTDTLLAKHVAFVHMNGRHPNLDHLPSSTHDDGDQADNAVVFTPHEVRSYVAQARTHRPVVPASVSEYMVRIYVRMRQQQRRAERKGRQFAYTTPRTLLGVVRLAQALSRLRFDHQVSRDDVDEAIRLIEASKESLHSNLVDGAGRSSALGASSRIYSIVRTLADSGACRAHDGTVDNELGVELSLRQVRERVIANSFTQNQWLTALVEYTDLDVWQTTGNGARLVFVTAADEGDREHSPET